MCIPHVYGMYRYLTLESSNETLIKAAVVFADRLFDGGESVAVHERTPGASLRVPLRPPKDVAAELLVKVCAWRARTCTPRMHAHVHPADLCMYELLVKALAGSRGSSTFHVFELSYTLPKFAMHVAVDPASAKPPAAGVQFALPGAATQLRQWVASTFNTRSPADAEPPAGGTVEYAFVSLRGGQPLWLRLSSEAGGTMRVLTEDMELAGEVLQDLCAHLGVTELESEAEFPQEFEEFRAVLLRVDEYNATRLKLTAEMADASNTAKTLVIRAEDARILGDIKAMRAAYAELYSLNAELIGEYTKRSNNHEQLLAALKDVNHMIQKTARLRVGAAKARIVAACRQAIKANSIHSLFKIMKSGNP